MPLRIMELCVDALAAAGRLADIGSRLAVSDPGCARLHSGRSLRAASLNVLVNTKAMGAAGAPADGAVPCPAGQGRSGV